MKKVVIIGGGIAGLSAGVYARQSGFDTTIYESHSIPGGNCTGWKRKGYYFEGGLHWLTGSKSDLPMNSIWRNIGAIDDQTVIYNRDPFYTFEHEGTTLHLYRNPDELERHWTKAAPQDARAIQRLCKDIRIFSKISMPVMDIKGVKVKEKSAMPSMMSMLPGLMKMFKYQKMSVEEYCARFTHPAIRAFLCNTIGEDYNAMSLIFTLSTIASGDGGYLKGGSLEMAQRIARRYTGLGGEICYSTPVERVIVKDGQARGVVVGGKEVLADAVIVTADTITATQKLFNPPLSEPWIEEMRQNVKPVLNVFVSMGVKADLSNLPEYMFFTLEEPFAFAGSETSVLGVGNYASFKEYAPEGCTSLILILMGDTYDFWKRCKEAGTYTDEKQKLADGVTTLLEEKIPQIKGNIDVIDVATPLTYERYCATYKGSWMTAMPKGAKNQTYPYASQSVKGLYFAGQRIISPGGLPVASLTGRQAVQHVCRDFDAVFQGNI